jgi:hypothetical protein
MNGEQIIAGGKKAVVDALGHSREKCEQYTIGALFQWPQEKALLDEINKRDGLIKFVRWDSYRWIFQVDEGSKLNTDELAWLSKLSYRAKICRACSNMRMLWIVESGQSMYQMYI